MTRIILIFELILLACSCTTNRGGQLEIVCNGKSNYSIVISSNASGEELRAANLLQDHLKKISGCVLPVIKTDELPESCFISISKSADIKNEDAFTVFSKENNIFIKGGSHKGCIYGICEILYRFCKVRYYSPDYKVLPQSENVVFPVVNISDSSINTFRCINGNFEQDQDYMDFNRLDKISDMFADGYYVHTLPKLLPWEEYIKPHPEYFALKNDKRIIDQPCLSNPEVLKLVIEKLKKEMLLQPEKKVWSVSQNDNFSYCQCDKCKKIIDEEGSASGPVIRFVNNVAEQFPDKIISTLAYQYSRHAPLKTKPRNNVQVMLCSIELNRSKPIEDDSNSVSFQQDIKDWGRICKHIYLWDYTVDFAHSISPFPDLQILQPNIRLFDRNNIREHFQQSNTGVGHEFSELKSYLIARLLWNPETDTKKIIEEFTDGFYGNAGIWLRKYIYHLQEEIMKTGEWLDIYGPPANHQYTFLSDKNIAVCNTYFDEAEKAASGNAEQLLHVRTARMPLQYAMMEIGKGDMFGPRGWYNESKGEWIIKKEMLLTLENFYRTSKECHSAPVNESGLTAEAYYLSTKRFIDVQVKGNLAFRKKVTAVPLPAAKYSGGDLKLLTNGVRGANDFKVHWLGWESKNFSLLLDLEQLCTPSVAEISTLWDAKSWILHPKSVKCSVSANNKDFTEVGEQSIEGDQQKEEVTRVYTFKLQNHKCRYIKFDVKGTLHLFKWHASAGGDSWVFVDEIVVR